MRFGESQKLAARFLRGAILQQFTGWSNIGHIFKL
jgi:hypothetical protein